MPHSKQQAILPQTEWKAGTETWGWPLTPCLLTPLYTLWFCCWFILILGIPHSVYDLGENPPVCTILKALYLLNKPPNLRLLSCERQSEPFSELSKYFYPFYDTMFYSILLLSPSCLFQQILMNRLQADVLFLKPVVLTGCGETCL